MRLRIVSAAILAPLALGCVWLGGGFYLAMLLIAAAAVAYEWSAMCRRRPLPLAGGLLYALMAGVALYQMRQGLGSAGIFFLLAVVWCSDIGAYAAGRLIGGPRLAPAISPGKTWSGAVGGLAAAVLGGAIVAGSTGLPILWTAVPLGVASQLGDLGESALKRHYHVKDSGTLLPGHGGLLDRVDGLLAAAILLYAFVLAGAA